MKLGETKSLKEIVASLPASAKVLEGFGIDFCCDGNKPLGQACQEAGVTVSEVLQRLEEIEHLGDSTEWDAVPLSELMKHIVEKHHAFCRQELTRLGALLADVLHTHAATHSELTRIQKRFAKMGSELLLHLVKEEQTLFPMIARMEEAAARNSALPRLPFGTIENPIGMMVFEHDEAGVDLTEIRKISNDFTAPPDADSRYRSLYEGLRTFEQDMHEHVFLENYVLFPRATAIEKPAKKGSAAP